MLEITNLDRSPLQLIVKSRKKLRAFTTKVLPGRGSGHNKVRIPEEISTEWIDRLKDLRLIDVKVI